MTAPVCFGSTHSLAGCEASIEFLRVVMITMGHPFSFVVPVDKPLASFELLLSFRGGLVDYTARPPAVLMELVS